MSWSVRAESFRDDYDKSCGRQVEVVKKATDVCQYRSACQFVPSYCTAFQMNISLGWKQARSSGSMLRLGILVWLSVQNSIHTLLIRYSRTRDVEKMFLSSVAVFFTEIFKIITCVLCIVYEEGVYSMLHLVKKQVFGDLKDTIKVCIPAVLYTVQNNLFYLGASHLEAATFMVTSQFKIFTTALFTMITLKRVITRKQWLSLSVLFAGICLVQLRWQGRTKPLSTENPFLGFFAVLCACFLSGFAGIYFEKILKSNAPVSIWMRNVQMSVFTIPSSFIASLLQDYETIYKEGILCGFDELVWIVILWYCIGGLSVAMCIKYVDNIAKNFATSVAIIISTVASIRIFNFSPDPPFLLGAALVITSIFIYSAPSHEKTVNRKLDFV